MARSSVAGGIERALGQPSSSSNWTAVTKFMFSARTNDPSVQETGLACSLILIYFESSLFSPQVVSSVYKVSRALTFLRSLLKSQLCKCENAIEMRR